MMFENENIKLRALEPDDVELLYHWENDTSVWRVSNTHSPLSKFMLANYIKSSNADIWESKQLRLVIENGKGNAVGTIELFDFEPYHSRVGVGIIIFSQADRKKGFAIKALELIISYAETELGVNQLYANIAESNEASIQLFQKLGFVLSGIKKQWLRRPNGWENELIFQRLSK